LTYIQIRYTFVLKNKIMKTLSLKLDEAIFNETERILTRINKPRNRYINEAIEYYNKIQRNQILEKKLKIESNMVKEDSMNILNEFEKIDYVD